MLLVTQLGIAGYPCTPHQTARGVIKKVLQNVIAAVLGLAGLARTLPYILKINMAPKTARNSGDKTDGAKIARIGKDKGDSAGATRCPTSIMAKPTGRNTIGPGRDAKTNSNTPLLEVRGKDKSQSTITSFLAAGAQESCAGHRIPPPVNCQSVLETCSKKVLNEIKDPPIKASQGDAGLAEALDSSVVTKKKSSSPTSKKELQTQRVETVTGVEATGDLYNTTATLSIEAEKFVSLILTGRGKETERGLKPPDWAKDSGDKCYSLTEESDLSSGEHSLSESGSSMSSETGNILSSNELTVRQLWWQRKCTKTRSGLNEGTELSTFSGSKTLKWD
ncbi:hypothetical protein NDU88_011982 [Pleurodeles waltl]|uniref:Uncharacterized protein n=1 Tax=Pleurodeles waltl TaxID=8319 RepID=A0AAV7R200_PLEWA|nr:hypothetical protein NDU88_011982 [Pleurodeles waltl]